MNLAGAFVEKAWQPLLLLDSAIFCFHRLLQEQLDQGQDDQDTQAGDQIPAQDGNEQALGGGGCSVDFHRLHRMLLLKRGNGSSSYSYPDYRVSCTVSSQIICE